MSRIGGQPCPANRSGRTRVALWTAMLAAVWIGMACVHDTMGIRFSHRPSAYYGSGEYLARCPQTDARIRCYHYHRHWVCEQGETYFWDRNLDTAARTACGCPLPSGTAPASPAVSKEPATRFHDFPAEKN